MYSQQGFSDVVRHGETIKMFVGDVDRDEVESFCDQKQAVPQVLGATAGVAVIAL